MLYLKPGAHREIVTRINIMYLSDSDLKNVSNLESFSGMIPLFPLSSVVFFPNTLLPLHIFEPRYKQYGKRCNQYREDNRHGLT